MKALIKNEEAQAGIGTLIIFIAIEAIDEITDGTNLTALNMIEVTRCL